MTNLCLKQALTRPLRTPFVEHHLKEQGTRAGFSKAGRCPPSTWMQCFHKAVPRGSGFKDTTKSPQHALKRESRYIAPRIDANLSLSPAAFFDECDTQNVTP